MNIGIDARVLTYKHYTGLKTYAKNLIWALSKIDKKNQYTIISPRKTKIPNAKNFKLYLAKNPFPKLKRLTYEQLILPLATKEAKLDLLHSLENTGPIFCPAPLVLTIQDLRFFARKYQKAKLPLKYKINDYYQKKLIPLLVKRARMVICPSNYTASLVKRINKRTKVETVHHGIDPFWQKTKNIKREQSFLFINDYSPTKNAERTLKSFQRFIYNLPNFKLIIVASDRSGLVISRKTIAKLRLQPNTKIFYQPSNKELRSLYNKTQALLIPSILEGFGFPVLEAMACGCPVIASKTGSLPEIAGEAALYTNPYSIKDITQKMIKISQDTVLEKELINKGLKNIKRFSWEKTAQETLKVYKQVFERK